MLSTVLARRRAFSRELKRFLWEDCFDLIAPLEVGWNDGGCIILADAMLLWLGRTARPVVVAGRRDDPHALRVGRPIAQHALVRVDEHYLDGDGLSSESSLLRRWRTREMIASPYVAQDLGWCFMMSHPGLLRDAGISAQLAARFERRFPRADVLRLLSAAL